MERFMIGFCKYYLIFIVFLLFSGSNGFFLILRLNLPQPGFTSRERIWGINPGIPVALAKSCLGKFRIALL